MYIFASMRGTKPIFDEQYVNTWSISARPCRGCGFFPIIWTHFDDILTYFLLWVRKKNNKKKYFTELCKRFSSLRTLNRNFKTTSFKTLCNNHLISFKASLKSDQKKWRTDSSLYIRTETLYFFIGDALVSKT